MGRLEHVVGERKAHESVMKDAASILWRGEDVVYVEGERGRHAYVEGERERHEYIVKERTPWVCCGRERTP